jgi:serine/threonine protein kinase
MQIIELDWFDTAFPVRPEEEPAVKRRFMTLFADAEEPARIGGTSCIRKVRSFAGDMFALKQLIDAGTPPQGVQLTPEDSARLTKGARDAFYEEYRNTLLVSRLRGFPRLYGYGSIGEGPVIIMEWVTGISVREYSRSRAENGDTLSAQTIAALGIAVLDALEGAARLDATLVHRDISPANIMIRTDARDADAQAADSRFDICLIDFGSSAFDEPGDPSFTEAANAWRHGTPEYAAPEMLTRDLPDIDRLRKSPTIDVFALCSVLYELYAGHTPWRIAEHREVSAYTRKTETPFEPLKPQVPADEALTRAIERGLSIAQEDRPGIHALNVELKRFLQRDASDSTLPAMKVPASIPQGAHLEVASPAHGGLRAGEPIPPVDGEATRNGISRRSFIVGGLVIAAAAFAGGGFALQSLNGRSAHDFSSYPRASLPYGETPLYPAKRLASNSWVLVDARTNFEIPLANLRREPGMAVGNVVRACDSATGNTGFLTAVQSASGKLEAAWLVLPEYADAGDFSEAGSNDQPPQLAAVQRERGGLWGYIDITGSETINATFHRAERFSHGYASVIPEGEGLWSLIDTHGTPVLPAEFRSLGACSEEGLIAARGAADTLWGFVQVDGHWVVSPVYRHVRRFTEGLAAFCDESAGSLWGFIDASGATRIEPTFLSVLPFADGYAPAQDASTKLWGLIDAHGAWHVRPQFLAMGERTGALFPAHGSPAGVYDIYGADAKAWQDYLETATDEVFGYGYIDNDGTWALPPIYGDTLMRATAF